jgi:RNA polymerase sigma-70 factor, ECF subfamily
MTMADGLKDLTARFLAERHLLMAFIYGLLRNAAAAEDVFQEVWLKLAEASERGTPVQDLGKWCRGTARNLILHHWREQRSRTVVADSRIAELAAQAFDEHAASGRYGPSRRQALVECVASLPANSRELIRLKYESGLSVEAVAERVRRPYAGIMMALSRLRKALGICVQKRLRLAGEGS